MGENGNGLAMFETSSGGEFRKELRKMRAKIQRPDEYKGLAKDIHLDFVDALESLHDQDKARALYFKRELDILKEKQKSMIQLPKWLIAIIKVVDWLVNHPKFSLIVMGLFFVLINPSNRDLIVDALVFVIKTFL